ncbi:hypothetical protein OG792_07765 [Micromonospora sp. NBC_01699]|uniref:hypothetical protein n=1 Tax=Micromonospora sp. NBC_01699 TaxID=2975984 RepID=UPI002E300316|nr:hypothetical protein [Micromonospora sp. NBC_01699]
MNPTGGAEPARTAVVTAVEDTSPGTPTADAPTADPTPAGGGRTGARITAAWRGRRWPVDLAVVVGYLLAAGYVTGRLWLNPDHTTRAGNDQMLFEWMLARAAHAVTHLENPLYSSALNAPDGVNLMANTSVLGLGLPLTPVTLLFGSHTTFLLAIVGSLAGTAAAWYLFLSRRLVRSRFAACVGGLLCGFAPGMISQATGHLHMISQFLVPAILALVFTPATDRVLRRGVLLGPLVAYQVFLGEEVLVFLVLACGLFTVGYAGASPTAVRRLGPAFLGRLGTGALVAGVLLAYPLWFQFLGPGHYRGLPFDPGAYALDVGSFTSSARQSLTGHDSVPGLLSPNPTEENSFFGLPLLVLCAVVVLWLWRRPAVKALAVGVLVFATLSLGDEIRLDGRLTGLTGPYRLVADLPLLDLAVPARFPLVCLPMLAVLLALATDEVFRRGPATRTDGLPVRLLWTGALVAVALPVAPLPLRTVPAWPVPEFVATGEWRSWVPPGRTLVPVPPTRGAEATAGMYWSARTGLAFTAPGGYFIGPTTPDDRQARWGAPDRPTAVLLDGVAFTGQVPPIGDEQRRQAIEDLRHWRAAVVVQGGLHRGGPVKETVDLLLGPGQMISGAWVWDVRDRVP